MTTTRATDFERSLIAAMRPGERYTVRELVALVGKSVHGGNRWAQGQALRLLKKKLIRRAGLKLSHGATSHAYTLTEPQEQP